MDEIAQKTCEINELKFKRKEKERQLAQEKENLRKCSDRYPACQLPSIYTIRDMAT